LLDSLTFISQITFSAVTSPDTPYLRVELNFFKYLQKMVSMLDWYIYCSRVDALVSFFKPHFNRSAKKESFAVHKPHGFTLVEALVVILLMALVAAFAVPNLISWHRKAKLKGAVNNLKGGLELARLKAIQENGPVAVKFTRSGYDIFRDNGENIGVHDAGEAFFDICSLPDGVRIDLAATTFADDGGGGKRTRFNGRGTALAGTVVLVNSEGAVGKIIVSSVGRIRIK
jgi:type IV fimbrial biogenesis protein FimT